jgi:hypothetical protein
LYYSGNNTESTRAILHLNLNTNLGDNIQGSQCEVGNKSVAESTDSTLGASILMSNPPSVGMPIDPLERLQTALNNVSVVDILATKTAELLAERFKGNLTKSDNKYKKSDRKSRRDKHEEKNKKDRRSESSNSKKTDRSQSRNSSRNSSRSSNGRSLSNRKERRKTWSDSDFKPGSDAVLLFYLQLYSNLSNVTSPSGVGSFLTTVIKR